MFNINQNIALQPRPYVCGTRKCDLCLAEKLVRAKEYPISTLNTGYQFISQRRHMNK